MYYKTIKSEKGFGLIQVLAALIIVTVAIAGLFISIYVAKHKALENYHYRVVLLKAMEKLEELKYQNMYNKNSTVDISKLKTGSFKIDDQGDETIEGMINVSKNSLTDLQVANYVDYDIITIKIEWEDGPEEYFGTLLNREKELILREDYFYRTDIVGR